MGGPLASKTRAT